MYLHNHTCTCTCTDMVWPYSGQMFSKFGNIFEDFLELQCTYTCTTSSYIEQKMFLTSKFLTSLVHVHVHVCVFNILPRFWLCHRNFNSIIISNIVILCHCFYSLVFVACQSRSSLLCGNEAGQSSTGVVIHVPPSSCIPTHCTQAYIVPDLAISIRPSLYRPHLVYIRHTSAYYSVHNYHTIFYIRST